jgi:hypothetical protein
MEPGANTAKHLAGSLAVLAPGASFERGATTKAGEGTRTLDNHVGNVVLYQLSYTRNSKPYTCHSDRKTRPGL